MNETVGTIDALLQTVYTPSILLSGIATGQILTLELQALSVLAESGCATQLTPLRDSWVLIPYRADFADRFSGLIGILMIILGVGVPVSIGLHYLLSFANQRSFKGASEDLLTGRQEKVVSELRTVPNSCAGKIGIPSVIIVAASLGFQGFSLECSRLLIARDLPVIDALIIFCAFFTFCFMLPSVVFAWLILWLPTSATKYVIFSKAVDAEWSSCFRAFFLPRRGFWHPFKMPVLYTHNALFAPYHTRENAPTFFLFLMKALCFSIVAAFPLDCKIKSGVLAGISLIHGVFIGLKWPLSSSLLNVAVVSSNYAFTFLCISFALEPRAVQYIAMGQILSVIPFCLVELWHKLRAPKFIRDELFLTAEEEPSTSDGTSDENVTSDCSFSSKESCHEVLTEPLQTHRRKRRPRLDVPEPFNEDTIKFAELLQAMCASIRDDRLKFQADLYLFQAQALSSKRCYRAKRLYIQLLEFAKVIEGRLEFYSVKI